jgi:hypothetical protein
MIGQCRYGNNCTFAHGDTEVRKIGDPLSDEVGATLEH